MAKVAMEHGGHFPAPQRRMLQEDFVKVAWGGQCDHTMRESDVQPERSEQKDRDA